MGLFPASVTSVPVLPGPGFRGLVPAAVTSVQVLPGCSPAGTAPGGIVPSWPPAAYEIQDVFSDLFSDLFGLPVISTTVVTLPGQSPTG